LRIVESTRPSSAVSAALKPGKPAELDGAPAGEVATALGWATGGRGRVEADGFGAAGGMAVRTLVGAIAVVGRSGAGAAGPSGPGADPDVPAGPGAAGPGAAGPVAAALAAAGTGAGRPWSDPGVARLVPSAGASRGTGAPTVAVAPAGRAAIRQAATPAAARSRMPMTASSGVAARREPVRAAGGTGPVGGLRMVTPPAPDSAGSLATGSLGSGTGVHTDPNDASLSAAAGRPVPPA
jgi:hypothetical protein